MKLLIEKQRPVRFVSDAAPGFTVSALPGLDLADYTPAIIANLVDKNHGAKESAKYRVKIKASEMIETLQWRIERAQERDSIGAEGETLAEVLREREAIRRASNRAEAYIDELADDTEARQYQFDVLPSDYPQPGYMPHTKLQFVRLIQAEGGTTKEQVTAAHKEEQLAFFWLMFELATSVERDDPEISEGLAALEQLGYLPNGAQAVLNGWPMA